MLVSVSRLRENRGDTARAGELFAEAGRLDRDLATRIYETLVKVSH